MEFEKNYAHFGLLSVPIQDIFLRNHGQLSQLHKYFHKYLITFLHRFGKPFELRLKILPLVQITKFLLQFNKNIIYLLPFFSIIYLYSN